MSDFFDAETARRHNREKGEWLRQRKKMENAEAKMTVVSVIGEAGPGSGALKTAKALIAGNPEGVDPTVTMREAFIAWIDANCQNDDDYLGLLFHDFIAIRRCWLGICTNSGPGLSVAGKAGPEIEFSGPHKLKDMVLDVSVSKAAATGVSPEAVLDVRRSVFGVEG